MKIHRSFIRSLSLTLISLSLSLFILLSIAYLYLNSQLPDVQALKNVQLPIPLRVYTQDGQLIAEFGELSRNPVHMNQVPPLLIKAILATEDQRFYEHRGVDFWGLLRASSELIITGNKVQGGSTITMQVARNFYLTRKKTFMRKLTEILLALKIERELNKQQILELYLNKIYLGNRAYGVSAAAQIYFGKNLNELSLAEMALIAGLPKAPSTINPIANPIAAKERRNHVLARMFELKEIDEKSYQQALATPVTASYYGPKITAKAPYLAEMVRDMMFSSFGEAAYTQGYNVYTTIDSQQQIAADKAVRQALLAYDERHGYRGPEANLGIPNDKDITQWLAQLEKIPTINGLKPAIVIGLTQSTATALLADGSLITLSKPGFSWASRQRANGQLGPAPEKATDIFKIGDLIRVEKSADNGWVLSQIPAAQGALVALNPLNGAITALVGGFDFNQSKFNRVTQAKRQSGSSFKPYIYAAALAKGYTLASIFDDAPLVFNIPGQGLWRPQDDLRIFQGPTRLRVALAQSINLVSVRLLQAINISYALKYLNRFGLSANELPRDLTLSLGTAEITPLEQARGYAVFANGGYLISPYFVDRVTDHQGNIIYQSQPKSACALCVENNMPADPAGNYAPQTIPTDIAFLMTSALQEVIRSGTGRMALSLGRSDLAGKTGTTNDEVDTWFAGFNSDIVAVAWVGFDQPSSLHEYGAQAALPLWINFMRTALAGKPLHTLPQPPDVVLEHIDPNTGLLTEGGIPEYFLNDNLPKAAPEAANTPVPVITLDNPAT